MIIRNWSGYRRRRRNPGHVRLPAIILTLLLGLASCTAGGGPRPTLEPASSTRVPDLTHVAGAFGVNDFRDLGLARSIGVTLVMANYSPEHQDFNRVAEAQGIHLLDTWVQKQLYQAYCPRGLSACHGLDPVQRQTLLTAVRDHVALSARSPSVAGYYLTDDYVIDMSDTLPAIADIIRDITERPTVCGLAMPLASPAADATTPPRSVLRSLTNYSPDWCQAILLYSYGPITSYRTQTSVDQSMETVLPPTLQALVARGWDPGENPLIGGPQAFGFNPRVSAPGRPLSSPEWATVPTQAELQTQIESFCRLGATSIIAYAWQDGSTGDVSELADDPSLQAGFIAGLNSCRRNYWR